jgi:hypothetical protein
MGAASLVEVQHPAAVRPCRRSGCGYIDDENSLDFELDYKFRILRPRTSKSASAAARFMHLGKFAVLYRADFSRQPSG